MKKLLAELIIAIIFISIPFRLLSQSKLSSSHLIVNDSLLIDKTALNFLVVGDWGCSGEKYQRLVASQMGIAAEKVAAKFIVSTGDNIHPNGAASEWDPAFRYSFEDVYTAHSLHYNWFLVLGNHDYKTNPEAEIAYSKISQRWNMPAHYYSKKFMINKDPSQKVLMVFIDTNPFYKEYYRDPEMVANVKGQDTLAQRKWMEQVLSDSDTCIKWKIVVGHHPLYTSGVRKENPDIVGIRGSLKGIMDKYKVDAYLSGHEHNLQHMVPKGETQYFISGSGSTKTPVGALPETHFALSEFGFMVFTVNRNLLTVLMVDYFGNVIYKTSIENR